MGSLAAGAAGEVHLGTSSSEVNVRGGAKRCETEMPNALC